MFFMTGNVLGNLFSKSATRLYPFQVREPFDQVRGELYIEPEKCILCKMCAMRCPSQCLKVDKKARTWEYDKFACVFCGVCVDGCPQSCLHQKKQYAAPEYEKQYISISIPAKEGEKAGEEE